MRTPPLVRGTRYRVDRRRADAVIPVLLDEWRARRGVFSHASVAPPQQVHIPRDREGKALAFDSLAYARWLLCLLVHMRGGITSHQAFAGHVLLHDRYPELYDLEHIATWPDSLTLARRISDEHIGLGFALRENARNWIHNAGVVVRRFGGDPRRIWEGTTDFREIADRTIHRSLPPEDRLRGVQEKILTLFLVFYQDFGLLPELTRQPAPVDFHLTRLLVAHRIVRLVGCSSVRVGEWLLAPLRKLSMELCTRYDTTPNELSHAMWVLGSEYCNQSTDHAAAVPTIGEMRSLLSDSGQSNKNIARYFRKLPADLDIDEAAKPTSLFPAVQRKEGTARADGCLRCPIFRTCELAANAAPYYLAGFLVTHPRRPPTAAELWMHDRYRRDALAPAAPVESPATLTQSDLFSSECPFA